MFTEAFMQRALAAALLLAPLCALLGVFATARRMAFFSDTVSHAALAGVGLGFWLQLAEPTVPIVAVAVATALAVLWLKENTELMTDTIMALLLSGSVSIGVIMLSLLKAGRGDIHRYLFGDILAVGQVEAWLALALFVIVGVWVFRQLSALTLLTAHEEMAHLCGVRVRRLNCLFVLVLTITVAVSLRLLGIVLVTSLLVIPPAAARNLSRNLRQQIVLSLACGLAGAILGIALSYELEVPCGPAIVVASIGVFLLTLVLRLRRR